MTQQARKLSFSRIIISSGKRLTTRKVQWADVKDPQVLVSWFLIIIAITFLLDSSIMLRSGLHRYISSLKWTPLPLGIGFALIGYQQYRHVRKREANRIISLDPSDCAEDTIEIQLYKLLPLKVFSRLWGSVNGMPLPTWSRNTILGSYVKTFNCNMAEAEVEDITQYRCLGELFRRKLKLDARPIDLTSDIVSPADGTVVSAGRLTGGLIEQVKGVTYSAKKFLGPNCWTHLDEPTVIERTDDECFHKSCLENPRRNELYQVTIYLAPGDYHRFHSPCNWHVLFRRHFPGELLSVNPCVASWIRNLFVLNERVSYIGKYCHGFFSMTAVGATNVGSVHVPFDQQLKTNLSSKHNESFDILFDDVISLNKGGDFGEFNLGSTIVLIFEAPKSVELSICVGDKVKMGQGIFKN